MIVTGIGPVFAFCETLVNRAFTVFSIGAGCPDGAAPPARSRAGAESSGDHQQHLLGAEHDQEPAAGARMAARVGLDVVGIGVKEKTTVIAVVTPRSAGTGSGSRYFMIDLLPAECRQAETPSRTRREGVRRSRWSEDVARAAVFDEGAIHPPPGLLTRFASSHSRATALAGSRSSGDQQPGSRSSSGFAVRGGMPRHDGPNRHSADQGIELVGIPFRIYY